MYESENGGNEEKRTAEEINQKFRVKGAENCSMHKCQNTCLFGNVNKKYINGINKMIASRHALHIFIT